MATDLVFLRDAYLREHEATVVEVRANAIVLTQPGEASHMTQGSSTVNWWSMYAKTAMS